MAKTSTFARSSLFNKIASTISRRLTTAPPPTLFINGKADASTQAAGGKILYHPKTKLAIAGYHDRDEDYPLHGELISTSLYEDVATEKWIAHEFQHNAKLTQTEAADLSAHLPLTSVISPYLQFATQKPASP